MVAAMWAFAVLGAAKAVGSDHQTCGDLKTIYKAKACCGNPSKLLDMQVVPRPVDPTTSVGKMLAGANICDGKKVELANIKCLVEEVEAGATVDVTVGAVHSAVPPQAGSDVTIGASRLYVTTSTPIMSSYMDAGLCPVNVHWHLGSEHKSTGQYDENGVAPAGGRRLSYADVRYGFKCSLYNGADARFTTEYECKHCGNMHVGDTYEVHWPHSKAGACGTPNQYQYPFYDGVFCRHEGSGPGAPADADTTAGYVNVLNDLDARVAVQAQIFTIVNDEDYYYPDLARGMIIDGAYGNDMAHYTGSTTGTTRDNVMCSAYGPITWQVDRTCHLISASSFDKMCADMKQMRDDMSGDLHPHGARELVLDKLAANNMASP
jgi:hypothetical protein